jgi:hypothetical protein
MADWVAVHSINERVRLREVHLYAPSADRRNLDLCLHLARCAANAYRRTIGKAARGGISLQTGAAGK